MGVNRNGAPTLHRGLLLKNRLQGAPTSTIREVREAGRPARLRTSLQSLQFPESLRFACDPVDRLAGTPSGATEHPIARWPGTDRPFSHTAAAAPPGNAVIASPRVTGRAKARPAGRNASTAAARAVAASVPRSFLCRLSCHPDFGRPE